MKSTQTFMFYVTVRPNSNARSPALPNQLARDRLPCGTQRGTIYRCFLPDLTRFIASCCARPIRHHYFFRADQEIDYPPMGIHPAIADCRSQGTANSPCSTVWRRVRDLNPRYAINVNTISNRAPSAAQPTLQDTNLL